MTRICRVKARSLLGLIAAAVITVPAVFLASCKSPSSQTNPQYRPHVPTAGETRAQNALSAAEHSGMPELYALLRTFPKGADLHMHLSGAVYAETFIDEAVREGLCVAPVDAGKPASPIGKEAVQFVAPKAGSNCSSGAV